MFWVYERDKDVCIYCDNYINLKVCDNCNITNVSYDVEVVDDIYLNLSSGTSKKVTKFLGELQGNMSYSVSEWERVHVKLDSFFGKTSHVKINNLTEGIVPGTSASMMKDALTHIGESSTDSSVYSACIYYWKWEVFDFTRYINSYRKYISIIDLWCGTENIKMNKMFKYYWVSLIIGFDVSRHYFRIPNENIYITMISIARNISKNREVPVPEAWVA